MRQFKMSSLFREFNGVEVNFGPGFQILRTCKGAEDRWGSYCLHGEARGKFFLCFFREDHPMAAPFVFFSEHPFLINGRELVKPDAEVFVGIFNAWSGYYTMAVALGIILHALLPERETSPTVRLASVQLSDKVFPLRVAQFCFEKKKRRKTMRRVASKVGERVEVSA